MALTKRGKTWWVDATVNGQRYRESLQTTDKREAISRERELVRRIEEGKLGTASNKTYARLGFSEAADAYVASRKGRVAEVRRSSRTNGWSLCAAISRTFRSRRSAQSASRPISKRGWRTTASRAAPSIWK